ncbi:hypothetical protein KM043_014775 [Ampulex compressa]|nr:hypothetical protein KM043_014775 [Ampulex compressa]
MQEDNFEDDFVTNQRRYKERASAAFEEDLAELRRKRRDMQDRIFDVIDLNAEIEKARTTLEAADIAFGRHATKFDNNDITEDMTLTQKLDRTRKIAGMDVVQEKQTHKPFAIKWTKVPEVQVEPTVPQPMRARQNRINSLVDAADITDPLDSLTMQPLKRRFLKRKKSVSF